MRKFLSLFIIATLLIVPLNAFALEEGIETYSVRETPVFDADISSYMSGNAVITDKSSNGIKVDCSKCNALLGVESSGNSVIKYIGFNGGITENNANFTTFRMKDKKISALSDMTVEIWAKPQVTTADVSGGNGRVLFSVSKSNQNNSTFNATFTASKLKITANGKTAECDVSDYMNKWSQFTFTRKYNSDNTLNIKAYVNSVVLIDETFSDVTKETETDKYFYVGAYGSMVKEMFPTMFIGGISEVRIYSGELTETNIGLNYFDNAEKYNSSSDSEEEGQNTQKDLLFALQADGIKDVSGNNIAITSTGTVASSAYSGLNGDISFVNISNKSEIQNITFADSKLLNNKETTVEFYMKTPDFTDIEAPRIFTLANSNTANGSLYLEFNKNGVASVGKIVNKAETPVLQTADLREKLITDGEWTYVALTRKFDSIAKEIEYILYINGEKVGNGTATSAYSLGEKDEYKYTFGMTSTRNATERQNKGYNGGFSDIRIYSKVLTADEVKNKYANTFENYIDKNNNGKFTLEGTTDISRTDSKVNFKINGDTATDIKLTDALTGKEIDSQISYSDSIFKVDFGQYLKYGQKLKISSPSLTASNIVTVNKGNSQASATVINSDNMEITAPDGSKNYIIKLEVKNNGTAKANYKYSFALKDENGECIGFKNGSLSVNASDSDFAISSFNDTSYVKEIRIYVWENNGGIFIPVYNTPVTLK